MARYYFDIVESGDRTADEVGLEFATVAGAMAEASRLLVELARDAFGERAHDLLAVEVRDRGGLPRFSATLRLDITGPA